MRSPLIDVLKSEAVKRPGSIFPIAWKFIYKAINKIRYENQNDIYNKTGQEYWKNHIFSILSILIITLGAPLFLFSAYMFYIHGNTAIAIFQILEYITTSIVISRKSFSVESKKFFLVLNVYFISLLLLVTTGVMGAGMVCVFFSLILVGCLLDKKQTYQFMVVNIIVFVILTVLLMHGYLDGTYIKTYKSVWYINIVTTQMFGIMLIFLMNAIFSGLENQTKLINKSKELLTASESKHKAMVTNISDIILVIDENGQITYVSPNMEHKYGWIMRADNDKPIWERVHPEERNRIMQEFKSILKKERLVRTIETKYFDRHGEIKHIELTAVNLMKDTNINGILINYHDITERKIWEEEILYINYYDSLTGLYNRTFFEKEKGRFEAADELPVSIIIGDINGLKMINDSLGHTEGDKLLVAIAKILRSCCRKDDIIARIGGDEFVILLPETSIETADEIIKNINAACEEYNKNASSETYYTNISLGSATKTNMEESLDNILRIAEDNMYRRKLLEGKSLHSSVLASMKTALFEKSQETEEHALRLVKLSKAVGEKLGLNNQQFDELELFATLHDIGKIGIDDQILNKPGKLTDEEWIEMKKHCEVGYRIAMSSPELMPIADYIYTHHERWDGKGYPQGMAGEDIPLLSRILAVVDAYDAMIEDRPYRKALTKEAVIAEIINNAGKQFDPMISKIFIEII